MRDTTSDGSGSRPTRSYAAGGVLAVTLLLGAAGCPAAPECDLTCGEGERCVLGAEGPTCGCVPDYVRCGGGCVHEDTSCDEGGDGDGEAGGDGDGEAGGDGDGDAGGDGDGDAGGDGDGDGDLPTGEVANYMMEVQELACEWQAGCGYVDDESECLEALDGSVAALYQEAVDSGAFAFDDEAAAACLELWNEGFPCEGWADVGVCEVVFLPALQTGDDCSEVPDLNLSPCQGGYCSHGGEDCSTVPYDVVCRASAQVGESCEDRYCDPELRCLDGLCALRGEDGDTCVHDSDCQEGLACECDDPDLISCNGVGTCEPILGLGDTCTDNQLCDAGLYCACELEGEECVSPGTCADYGELGDPCDEALRCRYDLVCHDGACDDAVDLLDPCVIGYDECPAGAVCHEVCDPETDECDPPACHPATAEGEACDYSLPDCAEGLKCILGICSSLGLDGDPCEWDSHCAEGRYCVLDTCRAPGGYGAPCQDQEHCTGDAWCPFTYASETASCQPPSDQGADCNGYAGVGCQEGLYCQRECEDFDCEGPDSVCRVPSSEGGECNEGTGQGCQEGLRCFASGSCHPPLEPGALCESSRECQSDSCVDEAGEPRCSEVWASCPEVEP